jgi:glucosamine kinase
MSSVSGVIPATSSVLVGIDAGGSSTRARAMAHARIVHEGQGGPGNPVATGEPALSASYAAAVAGCPPAGHVAACVSGAASPEQQARVAAVLVRLLPGAEVVVHPDYVAAMAAAPADADLVVIAGTGSLACSRTDDGGYATSGGRGWIVGDSGSAARLGRAALEWYCDAPEAASPEFAAAVAREVGSADWRSIVRALSAASSPGALLARAAPLLTCAAEHGAGWARDRLGAEMTALAELAARHAIRHLPQGRELSVALSGGVWASELAQTAFTAALSQRQPGARISRCTLSPLDGALRLAESMSR